MGKVELIEKEIEHLDDKAFAEFRTWFIDYEHARWDGRIAADSAAGKLDALIDEALSEHRSGKTSPL